VNKHLILIEAIIVLCGMSAVSIICINNVAASGWISISSPYGGEIWYTGETYTITWDSYDIGSYVDIDLIQGGYHYSTIASWTYNDGSYSWTISSSIGIGSYYYIEITDSSDINIYDYSGYFSIDEVDAYITVTSPVTGLMWTVGETYTITWVSENAGSYVDMYLYESGAFHSTIVTGAYNDGSYSWAVPSDLNTLYSFKIKIISSQDSSIYDDSEYFEVESADSSITVTSPSSWDTLYVGDTQEITWISENAGSYVKIELYESGYFDSTITSSTYNDGSHSWTISSSLSTSSYYQIRVTSTSDSSIFDESDYFSINELEKYISITSPYYGETFYPGDSHAITWSSNNAGSYVKIELYKNGYFYSTIDSYVYNGGSYYWEIPSSLNAGSYEIKIASLSDDFTYDSAYLTIEGTSSPFISDPFEGWEICIIGGFLVVVVIIVFVLKNKAKKPSVKKPKKEDELKLNQLKGKVEKWKKEGYDVNEIEDEIDSMEKP